MNQIILQRIKNLKESIDDCISGSGIYSCMSLNDFEKNGILDVMKNTLELNEKLLEKWFIKK